jgi:hypothetical protein
LLFPGQSASEITETEEWMQIEIQHSVEQMNPDAGGSGTEKASEEPLVETSLDETPIHHTPTGI